MGFWGLLLRESSAPWLGFFFEGPCLLDCWLILLLLRYCAVLVVFMGNLPD